MRHTIVRRPIRRRGRAGLPQGHTTSISTGETVAGDGGICPDAWAVLAIVIDEITMIERYRTMARKAGRTNFEPALKT